MRFTQLSKVVSLSCAFAAAQASGQGVLSDPAEENDIRINLDAGWGNSHWSYGELTAFQPIINNDAGLLAVDMHYMTHVGEENSDSNEASLGLVYRKPLNDGDSFIGVNTSYSLYKTWDGNRRQTPHVGFEYVSNKFTFYANYMWQDDTIHTNDAVTYDYHPVYHLGDGYVHAGETFTGGYEAVGRYSVSDRLSLGIGYYDRHGHGQYELTETVTGTNQTTGAPVSVSATSQAVNSFLLREGFFIDGEMTTDFGTFSLQLKNDDQHDFLGMLTFRLPLGNASRRDLRKTYVERKYVAPVYKADPDDFGLAILAIAAAVGAESAAAVTATTVASVAAADAGVLVGAAGVGVAAASISKK